MDEQEILQLVVLAQSGDKEAFNKLALGLERTVRSIVFKRLRKHVDAQEVAQDVLIQAYRKLPQLREPERFLGWIKRIAIRLAINRAVRGPRELLSEESLLDTARSARDNPIDKLLKNERAAELRVHIEQLKEIDRSTLKAFYFDGQSLQEMKDHFACPIGTIKRRLHTARNHLRDELNKLEPV